MKRVVDLKTENGKVKSINGYEIDSGAKLFRHDIAFTDNRDGVRSAYIGLVIIDKNPVAYTSSSLCEKYQGYRFNASGAFIPMDTAPAVPNFVDYIEFGSDTGNTKVYLQSANDYHSSYINLKFSYQYFTDKVKPIQ